MCGDGKLQNIRVESERMHEMKNIGLFIYIGTSAKFIAKKKHFSISTLMDHNKISTSFSDRNKYKLFIMIYACRVYL